MEIIRNWVNGARNYKIGVQLYLQYGSDQSLKDYFQTSQTPFSQQKLSEELIAILDGPNLSTPPEESKDDAYILPLNLFSKDPIIEELYRRKSALHKQKDLLRHNLESYPTDTERGVAAFEIIRLRKEIVAIWKTELYYKQYNRLPEADTGVVDPTMLKHRRSQVNTNIRRLRSQLKKEPYNDSYKDSLAKFEAEYADLKQKIIKYKEML